MDSDGPMALDLKPTLASISTTVNIASNGDAADVDEAKDGVNTAVQATTKQSPTQAANASNFPAPKTDKPRPHVCGTCSRSFARLEHLKRHERSHTKEKPFECPECTRCFARRDLLLRHQQKLHLTTTTPSKPRGGRRESTSSATTTSGRIRKNSVANASVGGSGGAGSTNMRPRANTTGTFDGATLGMLAGSNRPSGKNEAGAALNQHFNINGFSGSFENRGHVLATNGHGNPHNLPKLATHGLSQSIGGDLRTAPPGNGFDYNNGLMFPTGPTINPAQLHMPNSAGPTTSSFGALFSAYNPLTEEEDAFEWMPRFDAQMSFNPNNEQAIDQSSPSAMSATSAGGNSESMLDGSAPLTHSVTWPSLAPNTMMPPSTFGMDSISTFSDFATPMGTVSPKSLHDQGLIGDNFYPTPPSNFSLSPATVGTVPSHFFNPPMAYSTDGTSLSSSSISGSARHSSVTSISTDSITDATRQALLISLSQPSVFGRGNRKYSQPTVSSPLSPSSKPNSHSASLPSTADLQRYVNAYIQYFHAHFPFLHIPTLSFDSPTYTSNLRPSNTTSHYGIIGGGGCLILAMAAIGALYEFDRSASKELFEAAKKMIQLYLEERRKADMSAAVNGNTGNASTTVQNTPLWLVQAMLLNVIYGINCADRVSSEIASTHCAALVSLARAAELTRDTTSYEPIQNGYGMQSESADVQMTENGDLNETWGAGPQRDEEQLQWFRWSEREERKRTLYGVFHLCSLLVSAYNHAPALMNSEIQLTLPCDEELWAADSAQIWNAKGGLEAAEAKAIPFSTALSSLLSASHRHNDHQNFQHSYGFGSSVPIGDLPPSELRPSTFGCLVLINALHNYIWETRQRHLGRQWTTQETESMHAYIEPALRAWQAAWASNPSHSLERPNPFGCGPLSADSIPLLDLAYVRLFVNLGRSKEAFWQRDFDAMANELATGTEIIQHADNSGSGSHTTNSTTAASSSSSSPQLNNDQVDLSALKTPTSADMVANPVALSLQHQAQSSKRERHLRKAAFYAADSLSMSDKLGVTFADFTSRELPVQSAMCAFDCAQVLAEWVATVQERVGQYLGVLGRDDIDYSQVPAIMLLEDEDCKLLEKISDILKNAEAKMTLEIPGMCASAAVTALNGLPSARKNGYGGKILMVTAYMLERAAVWPVTQIMAQSLEFQAVHMDNRAEKSTALR